MEAAKPMTPPLTPEARAAQWKTLAGYAAKIADEETRAQYLADFRARFDATYPPPPDADADEFCLPDGRVVAGPSARERRRLTAIARAWWSREGERLNHLGDSEADKRAFKAIAYHAGRRVAAELIERGAVETSLDAPILTQKRWADHFADGLKMPFDLSGQLLAMRLSQYPMTDLGNAERFRDRYGDDFIYTTAKGWLSWDGKRWRILDQEKDVAPAEVQAAVSAVVRALQDEAKIVGQTGWNADWFDALPVKAQKIVLRDWGGHVDPDGMDILIHPPAAGLPLSQKLARFGRVSEASGRLGCIANLARQWLTREITQFDLEQLTINCGNGTLRFEEWEDGRHSARLDPHQRGDFITRLTAVDYDPESPCPVYDATYEWAQPDTAMQRYLDQWAGYNLTGDTGAQILHLWHGEGANGKSTIIDAWAGAMGDYAGTIGIETFLDQGVRKHGDAATPALARLGGVRLLRASEPQKGAKLDSALIKAITGGEPMAVRALHKGFFDLTPNFKITLAFNRKPRIPDTDGGIWRRVKMVPWDQQRAEGERDEKLKYKLIPEFPGIFARLVRGLVDWMDHGFVEPNAVRMATDDFRAESDALGRFLAMCTAREVGARTQSSHLFGVYQAWCQAVGETEWNPKGFKAAMQDKGWSAKNSNGVQWEDLRLTRHRSDFVDDQGKVIVMSDDGMAAPPPENAPPDPDPEWAGY
jgi:DNA primase